MCNLFARSWCQKKKSRPPLHLSGSCSWRGGQNDAENRQAYRAGAKRQRRSKARRTKARAATTNDHSGDISTRALATIGVCTFGPKHSSRTGLLNSRINPHTNTVWTRWSTGPYGFFFLPLITPTNCRERLLFRVGRRNQFDASCRGKEVLHSYKDKKEEGASRAKKINGMEKQKQKKHLLHDMDGYYCSTFWTKPFLAEGHTPRNGMTEAFYH